MARMHVVMVSKALVVGAYQRKAEEIARLGVRLTVLVPPSWRDRRGRQTATAQFVDGYTYRMLPIVANGSFHLHFYPTLGRELARLRPDLLHMDEEPYNLATYLALAAAQRQGIPSLFFTWQNLMRSYPPPFRWWEQANYRRARHALAGNAAAASVLRAKGYRGPLTILPQFGVDPALFAPCDEAHGGEAQHEGVLRVGYAGGLVPEKGLDLLVDACAGLDVPWRLTLAGEGEARGALIEQAARLGVGERVHILPRVASHTMPAFYHDLDVLVLPSRTRPNWMEQFGRVLIEAMACGVAVVGSDSGEIPNVIGDAGLIFAEGDVAALRGYLHELAHDPARRAALGAAGRARVLAHFTMGQIAAATVAVYRQMAT